MPNQAHEIDPGALAEYLKQRESEPNTEDNCLIVDCRNFVDYNTCHVKSAINAFYSKIMRRRLLDSKSCCDFIQTHLSHGIEDPLKCEKLDLILYAGDEGTLLGNHCNGLGPNAICKAPPQLRMTAEDPLKCEKLDLILYAGDEGTLLGNHCNGLGPNAICKAPPQLRMTAEVKRLEAAKENNNMDVQPSNMAVVNSGAISSSSDKFIRVLFDKIKESTKLKFKRIMLLKGGFLDFRQQYPELCENNELASPAITPGALLPHQDVHSATASTSAAINGQAQLEEVSQRSSLMSAPYLNRLSLPSSFSQPCIASLASPSASSEGPTEILDYMFLGSQQDALDITMLKRNGITKIINLSENCPRPECIVNDECHFLRIPIKDSYCAKLQPHFERAFEFIEDARRTNQRVLVHCLAGISRSATLAIAYVMRCKGLASDEAYRFVKARRPSISPNFNFMGQLLEYEKVLRDEGILKGGSRPRSFNCPTLELTSVAPDSALSKPPPSNAEKSLIKSASSDVISTNSSLSSSHELALTNLENRKRTIDTPLTFPERPRQLMRNMRPQQSCRMQSVQEQDIPSPSTEFSKLDISLTNPCFGLVAASQASNNATASREPFSAAPMLENPMFALISAAQTSASAHAMPSTEPIPTKKVALATSKKTTDCCKKVASASVAMRSAKTSFFRSVFRKGKTGASSGLSHSHSTSAIHSSTTSSSTSTNTSRLRFRRLHARVPVDVLPTLHDADAPVQSADTPANSNESQAVTNGTSSEQHPAASSTTTTYSPVLLGDSPESGFVDDYASSSMDSQMSPTASKSSSVGAETLPAYRDPERESISSTSSLEIAVQ
ncbi:Protein VHP-1 a [Aphelenchoides avenae]|nr:Protein VHP-1 a [Aphelenchus avenae]